MNSYNDYIGRRYRIAESTSGSDTATGEHITLNKGDEFEITKYNNAYFICKLTKSNKFINSEFIADTSWPAYQTQIESILKIEQTCMCESYDLLHFGHHPDCQDAPVTKATYQYR